MTESVLTVIAFLSLGYLLFIIELVVPGGVLGILGLVSVAYGCYAAFELGFMWGAGSLFGSVVVFAVGLRLVMRSKAGKALMLEDSEEPRSWKSSDQTLGDLLGAEGIAATPLRPAGVATFGERRVDVVSDSEFLSTGTEIRVVEVEGRRVVVEAIGGDPADGEPADGEPADGDPADGDPADGEPAESEPAKGEEWAGESAADGPAPAEAPAEALAEPPPTDQPADP